MVGLESQEEDAPKRVSSFTSPWLGWGRLDLTVEMSPGLLVSGRRFSPHPKNPWLLGEMSESGFPDASGREEG